MTVCFLLISSVATWSAIELYWHGSLFFSLRKWASEGRNSSAACRHKRFLCQLLSCPFCLSFWVGLFFALLTLIPQLFWVIVLPFCICRLANLYNDMTHTSVNVYHDADGKVIRYQLEVTRSPIRDELKEGDS